MTVLDTRTAIELVEAMPALCTTAQRVATLLHGAGASAGAIAEVLEHDAPLSRRLLQLVNTRRGRSQPVTDALHAIQILGFEATGSLVRTASVTGLFKDFMTPRLLPLWRRGYVTAHGARELAQSTGIGEPEDAFATGLLLNLGQMLLWRSDEAAYELVRKAASLPGGDIVAAERARFGIAHVDLGYMLARRWHMPDVTVHALWHHHDPSHAGEWASHAALQYVADTMTTGLGLGLEPTQQVWPAELPKDLWTALRFDTTVLRRAAMEQLACVASFDGWYRTLADEGFSQL
ncbi:MAG: HDOD domain-containing protein [Myxococcales bacterium]|nr:HDOD domain-containing protein [Myxococcales bacterium]